MVVDVGMSEDVGGREEEIVYRQNHQILPRYWRRRASAEQSKSICSRSSNVGIPSVNITPI